MPASSVAMRVRYACTAAATSGSAGSPPAAARPSSAATSDTRCARSARRAASAAKREEGGREAWTALLARAAQPAATQALPIAAAMVRTRRGRRCSRARLARRLARAAPAQPTRGSTSAQLDKQASATRRNGNVHAPDIEEDYRRKMRAGDAANCERRCAAHRAVPLRRDARTPSERARKMPGKYLAHACARECTRVVQPLLPVLASPLVLHTPLLLTLSARICRRQQRSRWFAPFLFCPRQHTWHVAAQRRAAPLPAWPTAARK